MVLFRRSVQRRVNSVPADSNTNDHPTSAEVTPVLESHIEGKVKVVQPNRSFFFSRRFLFTLGIIFGSALGLAFIESSNIHDLHTNMALMMAQYDINLPELPDFDFTRFEIEWSRLTSNIPEFWKLNNDGREFQVGESIQARGLSAMHPVVLIPGIVSTGLESWSTSPEYRPFFRQKMWGGMSMLSQVTFNKEKWKAAMMLDLVTGLDPPGVKVRAAEGIDASSNFIQGYWLWSKIVENLAVVNYDTNNLHLAPYDWRLSYYNLEERDGYFSKLKRKIESLNHRHKKKVVIAAHSMGATILLYFFKWVESPLHGAGGADWVENNVEAYISIAGVHLGVVKALAAFLSGEMRDTVQMNPAGAYVLEKFFSRKDRLDLFHSWAGSASLWTKGGNTIWGNMTFAPDDLHENAHTHGQLLAFRNLEFAAPGSNLGGNMTAEEAEAWVLEHSPQTFQKMVATNYSLGIERNETILAENDFDHTKWTNPLEVRLPNAPSMKMYCVYGHGKETERSYWYTTTTDTDKLAVDATSINSADTEENTRLSLTRNWIDAAYTNEDINPKVRNGVNMGEGDGTVNLLSLGAMCAEGWKRHRWNPAGIKVTTVELPHKPVLSMPRGGANTSDHVDILGSTGLNEIILKVATGVGHEIRDVYVSNIQAYARNIQWD